MIEEKLLLIAFYLRRMTKPADTDAQNMKGVQADMARIIRAAAAQKIEAGTLKVEDAQSYLEGEEARAATFEAKP